jgi:hypothetical protein
MLRLTNIFPLKIAALLTIASYLSAGCEGVSHQPFYKGPIQSGEGMVPVKDEVKKFDFSLPPGWRAVPEDEELPETLKVPRKSATETGMGVWRKGDKGALLVWCETTDQNPYLIEQSLYQVSPSAQLVKGPLQVQSSGWNPNFRRYDSNIVKQGMKKGFSFFMGMKSQKLSSIFGCNYVVIGRSNSLETSREIESDFVSILKSLKN